MNNNSDNISKIKRPGSRMIESYKDKANPYYTPTYGISLNNINFWQKNVELQFIIVWAGGSSFTFTGLDARSILYSIGDKDNEKFNELNPDQVAKLQEHFSRQQPVAEQTN